MNLFKNASFARTLRLILQCEKTLTCFFVNHADLLHSRPIRPSLTERTERHLNTNLQMMRRTFSAMCRFETTSICSSWSLAAPYCATAAVGRCRSELAAHIDCFRSSPRVFASTIRPERRSNAILHSLFPSEMCCQC